jgi:hypothetical protein
MKERENSMWYDKKWLVTILCLVFFSVGLYAFQWSYYHWSDQGKAANDGKKAMDEGKKSADEFWDSLDPKYRMRNATQKLDELNSEISDIEKKKTHWNYWFNSADYNKQVDLITSLQAKVQELTNKITTRGG